MDNKKRLNIGITCYPTFGGSGVIATEIGMEMARRGHKVHFIAYDMPRRLERFMQNVYFHEVEVNDYPLFTYPPYSLSLASKMVEVSQYENLDILHVHYAIPHATSAYLAKQVLGENSPKIITTLHGTDITLVGKEKSYLPITKFSIEQSDVVTAPSSYLQRATYDKTNVSTNKSIEVVPNFVDADVFSPASPEEKAKLAPIIGACPLEEDIEIITHVSNFRPVKRISDVIHIFAKVLEKHKCHLLLIGDGPERSPAEALAKELGIKEHICFLGKQQSFIPILRSSDLFLLPSEAESFGLAALEAMSCGVPVVASNTQGIPEVVKHGETGFLSNVGDTESMANDCLKILNDKNLKKELSKNARQVVLGNYKKEAVVNKYEAMYQSLTS